MAQTEPSALLQPGLSIKPKVSESDVEEILEKVYGLKCVSIKELNGYDDNNYHVKVAETCDNKHITEVSKDGYVLKIVNTLESKKPLFFEAQDQILLYLNERNVCCSKPTKTRNGRFYTIRNFPSGNHLVRLLEFLTGSILHQVPPSNDLFYQCGQFAAMLDQALKDFHHPAYDDHRSIWMLDSLPQLSQFTYAVTEPARKNVIEEVIKQFCERVVPVMPQLEKGMIHGDFNEQNVLVEQKEGKWCVKGVLDFGDSHFGSYIYEVAITMAYMMIEGRSLDVGGYVLNGYLAVRKLPEKEINLLKICVAARLCQSLVMGAYSILQDPENSYILTTAKSGWALLEELWAEPEDKLLELWKNVGKRTE